jgi:hypothetical protein
MVQYFKCRLAACLTKIIDAVFDKSRCMGDGVLGGRKLNR